MRFRSVCLLSLASILAGCGPSPDDRAQGGQPGDTLDEADRALSASPTEYTTSLLFLAVDPGPEQAVVLSLANLSSTTRLIQDYHGWELSRSGWREILEAQLDEAPIPRAPWRILPVPDLHLTITADGDADDVILRVGSLTRSLELGSQLDGWEDRAGTRHEIREAEWIQGGRRSRGIVVEHNFALPNPTGEGRFGPFERAVLRSADGALIVIFSTPEPERFGEPYAWMYADGFTRRWTLVETRTVEESNAAELRRNVPVRIGFRIPEPDIEGELTVVARRFRQLDTESGPKPYYALYQVRGWIEFTGERRSVEGIAERGSL